MVEVRGRLPPALVSGESKMYAPSLSYDPVGWMFGRLVKLVSVVERVMFGYSHGGKEKHNNG